MGSVTAAAAGEGGLAKLARASSLVADRDAWREHAEADCAALARVWHLAAGLAGRAAVLRAERPNDSVSVVVADTLAAAAGDIRAAVTDDPGCTGLPGCPRHPHIAAEHPAGPVTVGFEDGGSAAAAYSDEWEAAEAAYEQARAALARFDREGSEDT